MSAPALLRRFARRLTQMHRAVRARAELIGMDDRELRDLGLGRSDIEAALSGRFDEPAAPRASAVQRPLR